MTDQQIRSVNLTLEPILQQCAREVEALMEVLLPVPNGVEAPLADAMRYSTLGSGKRLRPFLVVQSANLFGVDRRCAARVGAAVEFVHAYTLIHDDLPSMDDSDLRRGQPSCHRRFDEATAILAGDALQSLAFEVLAAPETHAEPLVRCELVSELAIAIGAEGLAGGQMIDLRAEHLEMDAAEVTRLQRMKTGALFGFCAVSGAILGRGAEQQYRALQRYAQLIGLAFQIADDLLDVEGSRDVVGKPVSQDAGTKATFVKILGIEEARNRARMLSEQATRALDLWDEAAEPLRLLARYIVERRN